jgi:hypothetical protein
MGYGGYRPIIKVLPPELRPFEALPADVIMTMPTKERLIYTWTPPVVPESPWYGEQDIFHPKVVPFTRPLKGLTPLQPKRLGIVAAGTLTINVKDSDGNPLSADVTIQASNTKIETIVDGTATVPFNSLVLGEVTVSVAPVDGFQSVEPFKLVLNPGSQTVEIVLQQSRAYVPVAVTVGVLAVLGIGLAVLS